MVKQAFTMGSSRSGAAPRRFLARVAAVTGLAVVGLAIVIAFAWQPGGSPVPLATLVADLALAAGSVLGAWAGALSTGHERRMWACIATASALRVAADAVGAVAPGPAALAAAMAIGVFAVLAVGGAVFYLTRAGSMDRLQRMRAGVDAAAFIVALAVLARLAGLGSLAWPELPALLRIAGVVRVAFGATMAVGLAAAAFGWRVGPWRPWERFAAAGTAAVGLGLVVLPAWHASGSLVSAGLLEAAAAGLTALGACAWALGATWRITDEGHALTRPEPRRGLGPASAGTTFLIPALELGAAGVAFFVGWSDPTAIASRAFALPAVAVLATLVAVRTALMRADVARLAELSVIDPVTGVYSIQGLDTLLDSQVRFAEATGEELSLIEIDIDGFGAVNDRAGHLAGDYVLRVGARALVAAAPADAAVFRSGGDSFSIPVPRAGEAAAHATAQALLVAFSDADHGRAGRITASAGVATLGVTLLDARALRIAASDALAHARALGGSQVSATTGIERWEAQRDDASSRHESYLALVHGLASAVDDRSVFTKGHGKRVSASAVRLATACGMDEDDVRLMSIAGRLHDLGKIGVPDKILDKPSARTAPEEEVMRRHPVLGVRVLSSADLPRLLPWIHHHHECWDGSGYPDGLVAEQIPLGARVLAVVDAWERYVVRQPTRRALTRPEAAARIVAESGILWDPQLAEALLELLDAGPARTDATG